MRAGPATLGTMNLLRLSYIARGDEFSQGSVVSSVGALHRCEVSAALPLEDNHGRIAKPDKHEVHDEPSSPAVSVDERMHALELVVKARQFLRQPAINFASTDALRGSAYILHPVLYLGAHQRPGRRRHASWERVNVVLTEAARSLAIGGIRMRRNIPDRGHRELVNTTDFTHGKETAVVPVTWLHGLSVYPARCVRVALDLVVFPLKGLAPTARPWTRSRLDFAQDQRVTFQGRGVVRFLMPDVGPDRFGLLRIRQAPPKPPVQRRNCIAKSFVDAEP